MTFVKLIKDLTLSFGEIQRKNAAYNNFCTKKYSGNDKTEKTFILKKNWKLKSGTDFLSAIFFVGHWNFIFPLFSIQLSLLEIRFFKISKI